MAHVIIIGGGIGGAVAHDLILRGFAVTLLDKGEILSGATGRHHGLLHSGARYVLHDEATARECMVENRIIKNLAPDALEQNNGLFVAVDDADMTWWEPFVDGCRRADIPVRPLNRKQLLAMEPRLSPQIRQGAEVPDAVMDAWRLPLHFFATAQANGADIRPFSEVVAVESDGNRVTGVTVQDHRRQQSYRLAGDIIVNAAGPWAAKVAAMLDIQLAVKPGPGVMVSIEHRLTHRVINRLHPAGDGDIIVPQRRLSLLGTSAWLADDPDRIDSPPEHVRQIVDSCAGMVPEVHGRPLHTVWNAARPLIVRDPLVAPTQISRSFEAIDHGAADHIDGFVSIVGGKATTMRAMAEEAADLVCRMTGRRAVCRTRTYRLLPYRRYFRRS